MYWTLVKIGLIRKRLRTFLTIMSMFIAFWLYGTLNTFSGVFTGGVDGLSAENIMVMPRYDMFGKLPILMFLLLKILKELMKSCTWTF